MVSPRPQQPYLKSGTYDNENNTFGDVNNLMRFFATKAMRASLSSPPLAHQIGELECVVDRATLRIYWKINGNLHFIQLT